MCQKHLILLTTLYYCPNSCLMVLHQMLCSGLNPIWLVVHSALTLGMSCPIHYRLCLAFRKVLSSTPTYFLSTLMIYQLSACSTQHQCRWYCHLCDWFFSPWNQQHHIVNPERLWHLDDNLQVQAQYFKDQVYVCTFFPLFSSTPEGCTWSNPHWAGLQFEISGLHY